RARPGVARRCGGAGLPRSYDEAGEMSSRALPPLSGGGSEGSIPAEQGVGLSQLALGAVHVESFARLASQPAGGDQVAEQGSWSVLAVTEVPVEHLTDRQHRIQADQIREGEGTQGVVEPEPNPRVDVGDARDALAQGQASLVQEWDEDAVDDEPRTVLARDRLLADAVGEGRELGQGLGGRLEATNDLDQLHLGDGAHAVEAAGPVGAPSRGGDARDRDARRVAREQGLRGRARVELPKELELELLTLRGRLDHELRGAVPGEVDHLDPLEERVPIR